MCTQSSVPTAAIQPVASSSCIRAGFSRNPRKRLRGLASRPAPGARLLAPSLGSLSPPPAAKSLPLLAIMDRATLLRAAAAYLHARDVRARRITAPAARCRIGVHSES